MGLIWDLSSASSRSPIPSDANSESFAHAQARSVADDGASKKSSASSATATARDKSTTTRGRREEGTRRMPLQGLPLLSAYGMLSTYQSVHARQGRITNFAPHVIGKMLPGRQARHALPIWELSITCHAFVSPSSPSSSPYISLAPPRQKCPTPLNYGVAAGGGGLPACGCGSGRACIMLVLSSLPRKKKRKKEKEKVQGGGKIAPGHTLVIYQISISSAERQQPPAPEMQKGAKAAL